MSMYSPHGLVLLGRNPANNTYHWEGPNPGTVWETAPGRLFGWLKAYIDDEQEFPARKYLARKPPTHYLMDPDSEDLRTGEDGWALVVNKADDREILRTRTEFVFAFKPSLIATVDTLRNVTSPCAFTDALMSGV